ncbi:MAG: nitrite reductase, copper-containing [Methylococcales bacterium]|nr:nitrite reductase, copper-containing [Methylococcales bacterium]
MNNKNITKKITDLITSTLNELNRNPNAKQFYIIFFIVAVVSLGLLFSGSDKKIENTMEGMDMSSMDMNNMDMTGMNMSGMDMKMMKHPVNFGPGDAFHIHKKVDPTKFKHVADISKKANDLPAALNRKNAKIVNIKLIAKEVVSDIAAATPFHYWTFDNTVPGPFLRVRVGDTIKLTLHNDKTSSHDHSIDLHAVTGSGGGAALTTVEPGETKAMQFKALLPGLFIYHCAAGNASTHIANGMYGLILVEPESGLTPVDKEFYVMQGELYTKGTIGERKFQDFDGQKMFDERPEYIIFNGRTSALVDYPIQAKVGETIRLFIGNGGVSRISSFHVIGEIFDKVYPEASMGQPLKNVQTTLIPAGGATMVEFKLDVPGDFVLVDHALTRIDRGAWGILHVTGKEKPEIYSAL